MKRRFTTTLGLLLLATSAACTTNPQPIPLPLPPDVKAIRQSNAGLTGSILVAGLPGAVSQPEGLEVVLRTTPGEQTFRGPAYSDGSFALRVSLLAGDQLKAWVEREGEPSATVLLPAVLWSVPNDAVIQVTSVSPVVGGQTTVSGSYTAGRTIILGNPGNGAAASTVVDAADQFSTSIAARPADRLVLFSFIPSNSNPATEDPTEGQEVVVPGP